MTVARFGIGQWRKAKGTRNAEKQCYRREGRNVVEERLRTFCAVSMDLCDSGEHFGNEACQQGVQCRGDEGEGGCRSTGAT